MDALAHLRRCKLAEQCPIARRKPVLGHAADPGQHMQELIAVDQSAGRGDCIVCRAPPDQIHAFAKQAAIVAFGEAMGASTDVAIAFAVHCAEFAQRVVFRP
jgi:hypothetical protein